MSPKLKKSAPVKAGPKAAPKAGKKPAPKAAPAEKKADKADKKGGKAAAAEKKGGKAAAKADAAKPAEGDEPPVDPDELEEQEDAAAASSSGGGGGNAAALAAASGSSEMSASFKNFRHHPDMENFYRFIYENDLRHEALAIIDQIMLEKQARKAHKGKGAH